jgi:hypothetical protein
MRRSVRAGRGLVTLLVEDLDSLLADLAERGFPAAPIEFVPGAAR